MVNITVGRYEKSVTIDGVEHEKGHEWAGYIEPDDASWIMFVGDDPKQVQVYLSRDPETGAVLDG